MKQPQNKTTTGEVTGHTDQSKPSKPIVDKNKQKVENRQVEYGGRKDGLDPTRYGDWEKNGRCIDF